MVYDLLSYSSGSYKNVFNKFMCNMQGVPVIRSTAEIPPNGYYCKEQLMTACMYLYVYV